MLPVLLVALAAAAALLVWRAQRGSTLVVANALAFPVRLDVGATSWLVPAGGVHEQELDGDAAVTVRWLMEAPRTRGGVPVGAELAGVRLVPAGRGQRTLAIEAERGDSAFFAPLISNQTGVPLTVRLNEGLAGAEDCPCVVPVGARRMAVGYYPLFANSTVAVADSAGRHAVFRDFATAVDPRSGTVSLVFNPGDLH